MTPSGLVTLMRTDIVKTGGLKNTRIYGRPEKLQLTEDTFFKGKHDDTPCKVYNIKQATTDTDNITAYVCDYGRNEINYQVLGGEADFCFTITINGCTFGIGSPTSDGSILVSHGNLAELQGTSLDPVGDQAERQLAVGHQLHGLGATYLTPDMYRHGKANVTMIGVRISGEWKFYFQRYSAGGGGTLNWLSFEELVTNSISL